MKKKNEGGKVLSKVTFKQEYKIDILFLYDLMIILGFRNVIKIKKNQFINFNKYYEDRKFSDTNELVFRILLAYDKWCKDYTLNTNN